MRRFSVVAAASATYIAAETALKAFGMSICPTDGCRAVSSSTKYGDWPFLAIGILGFATIALSARRLNRNGTDRNAKKIIDALLSIALPIEGLLIAYQYAFLQTLCIFCISVCALWITLFAIRTRNSWPQETYQPKPLYMAAPALAIALAVFLLSPPEQSHKTLPPNQGLSLFYNHDCTHCSTVMSMLNNRGIKFAKYPYSDYAQILKSAGITQVPTLMLTKDKEKIFITGETLIDQYVERGMDTMQPPSQRNLANEMGGERQLFFTPSELTRVIKGQKGTTEDICDAESKSPCPQ